VIHGLSGHLLGGHVGDRAQDLPLRVASVRVGGRLPPELLLDESSFARPKSSTLTRPPRHHDVGGLEVAVDDAALMRALNASVRGIAIWKILSRGRPPPESARAASCRTPAPLSGSESPRLLDGVDGDDAGMVERRHRLRLAPEAFQTVGIRRGFHGEDLSATCRSRPCPAPCTPLPSAPSDLLEDAVMRQRLPGSTFMDWISPLQTTLTGPVENITSPKFLRSRIAFATSTDECTWYEGGFAVVCNSRARTDGPMKALGVPGHSGEEQAVDNTGMIMSTSVQGTTL